MLILRKLDGGLPFAIDPAEIVSVEGVAEYVSAYNGEVTPEHTVIRYRSGDGMLRFMGGQGFTAVRVVEPAADIIAAIRPMRVKGGAK